MSSSLSQPKRGASEMDVSENDKYEFSVRKTKFHEYPEDILEWKGKVTLKNKQVGSLTAYLVQRDDTEGQFFSFCDSINREIQGCSVLNFDADGKLRKPLKDLVDISLCNKGGYLHITKLDVNEDHRGKDLGILLINELLKKSKKLFSVSIIQPCPYIPTHEVKLKLAKYFSRLGYQQIGTKFPYAKFWYLQSKDIKEVSLTKKEQIDLQLVIATEIKPPELSLINQQIQKVFNDFMDTSSLNPLSSNSQYATHNTASLTTLLTALNQLLSQPGACINEAGLLYIAAANHFEGMISFLIDLGANVNHRDFHGNTPLHIAAAVLDYKVLMHLITSGGDIHIQNNDDETPYQKAQAAIQGRKDFSSSFGIAMKPQDVLENSICVEILSKDIQ